MAYVNKRSGRNGAWRFTGVYKGADGVYKSAGTFSTQERALEVASAAERHALMRLAETSPADKATVTLAAYMETFLGAHDIFAAGMLAVRRSTVEVTARYHPTGDRFLTREYTKNGEHRRFKIDPAVSEMVREHVARHGIGVGQVIFPVRLFASTEAARRERLSGEEIEALGFTDELPNGRRYRHGTLGGYVTARCSTGLGMATFRRRRGTSRSWTRKTRRRRTSCRRYSGMLPRT